MREAGEALLLVALEDVDAGGRAGPEDAHDEQHDDGPEHGELPPRDSGDEEHGRERRRVDERRTEVGLGEDEQDRDQAEPDDLEGRSPRVEGALPLDEHPRNREHEQKLSELRRLEGEEPEADPARRPARRMPDQQDAGDHRGSADEDRSPVAAVEIRIDQRRGDERDSPDARIEDLAVQVVARVARERELRDAGDTPEPDHHERRHAEEQNPVEGADDREQMRRVALLAQSGPL
jgi:hypothetical protein